jgi:3-methylcrotonyl-CoA carboxylase alpha subunit
MPGTVTLRDETGRELSVEVDSAGQVLVDGRPFETTVSADGSISVNNETRARAWTTVQGNVRWVWLDGRVFTFETPQATRRFRAASQQSLLAAPMPATVRSIAVKPGDTVKAGDTLIVLEAMKMELPVRAAAAGRIDKINCREGDLVQPGISLVEVTAE